MEFCPKCNTLFVIVDDVEASKDNIGGASPDNLISKLIHVKDIKELIQNVDVDKLMRSEEYQRLTDDDKNHVYNKIQDALPLNKKRISKETKTKKSEYKMFYLCKNCLFHRELQPKTKIYSKFYKTKVEDIKDTKDYSHMVDNPILPRTKEYNCLNDECLTHKKPDLKEAVIITNREKQTVYYVCTVCKTQWKV